LRIYLESDYLLRNTMVKLTNSFIDGAELKR